MPRSAYVYVVALALAACSSGHPAPRVTAAQTLTAEQARCVATAAFPPITVQRANSGGTGTVTVAVASATGAPPLLCVDGDQPLAVPLTAANPLAAVVLLDNRGNPGKGPLLVVVLGESATRIRCTVGGRPVSTATATSAGMRLFWARVPGSKPVTVDALDAHGAVLASQQPR